MLGVRSGHLLRTSFSRVDGGLTCPNRRIQPQRCRSSTHPTLRHACLASTASVASTGPFKHLPSSREEPTPQILRYLKKTFHIPLNAQHVPNHGLEKKLSFIARNRPRLPLVSELVRCLIIDRLQTPSMLHYEALILANCDPRGSITNVREILSALHSSGLRITSQIDLALLEVRSTLLQSTY